MNRNAKIAAGGVLAALAAVGCGTTTVTAPAPEATATATAPTAAAPATAPSRSPSAVASSPSPAQQQSAGVGDPFTVTADDGTKYSVTLLSVDQQASPASEIDGAQPGHHLAAAEFRVTATTSVDENANNDATVTGSDNQAYTSSISSVAEGTNFADGDIRLRPGGSLVGWVAFELPDGVQVARVQWTPASGFSSAAAEWVIPSSPGPSAAPSAGPADTVRAYFAAITNRDYAQAWKLGGKNTGSSYASFVSGLTTTATDSVSILSVSGNVVTARLTAQLTDGTVTTYQGTYTVSQGVIVAFNVRQVG